MEVATCAGCGAPRVEGRNFCPACGTAVEGATGSRATPFGGRSSTDGAQEVAVVEFPRQFRPLTFGRTVLAVALGMWLWAVTTAAVGGLITALVLRSIFDR
jgi:hypothetical protein